MITEDALLAAVLAAPDDDLPRLVLADHYEGELGQPERAAWIRIQCELERTMPDRRPWYIPGNWPDETRPNSRQNLERHIWANAVESEMVFDWFRVFAHNSASEAGVGFIWGDDPTAGNPDGAVSARATIRRGFVSEVRCTLAEWCGGECPDCDETNTACPTCCRPGTDSEPTGFVSGIGPQVVRRHPVERVLTDREPHENPAGVFVFNRVDGEPEHSSEVPAFIFDLMEGGSAERPTSRTHTVKFYSTRELADKALSAALIAWAKSQPDPAADTTLEMMSSHP